MITASKLFAPEKHIKGNEVCFYCGLSCDETYTKKEYVKKTFTNRDIVMFPGSDYVCGCCVESFSYSKDITLVDGELKSKSRVPLYSWICTSNGKTAYTKKHIKEIREFCLNPTSNIFSITIADSGKKQLLFRTPVSFSSEAFQVQLEDDVIDLVPELLQERIRLAERLCAAIGKMKLLSPESVGCFIAVDKYYGDDLSPIEDWIKVYKEPISKLASWLSKPQKECQDEHKNIERRCVQKENSRDSRPNEKNVGDGGEGANGRGDQLSLDLT